MVSKKFLLLKSIITVDKVIVSGPASRRLAG
jgi:hypothetical protein